ncbi:FAD-dependent monooxygenase fsr3 [Paramyrothecium foliicola]|nr:FAD-dependent monooxygenase fsr3 [Paramyrothecium foliicola]
MAPINNIATTFDEIPNVLYDTVIVDGVIRYPSTGLNVLVVGGGPGDAVFIGPSAWSTLKNYPSMLESYRDCSRDSIVTIRKLNGQLVAPPAEFEWNRPGVPHHAALPLRIRGFVSRPGMNAMLHGQCIRLGISVTFGVNIIEYMEDDGVGIAIATAADGRRFTADIVVAADGLGTKSHKAVIGRQLRAVPTGFQVIRIMYALEEIDDSPHLSKLKSLKRPELRLHSGDKFHCTTHVANDLVVFALTTPDNGTAVESWSQGVTREEIVSRFPDKNQVDPLILEMIHGIPQGNKAISWQLRWRDPQTRWTTPGGRIIQLGDSAHAFIPTSIMGANTALEDAQSLAECLRLAGRKDANLGTKVHEFLRLQRVTILQRLGFANREEAHRKGGMEEAVNSAETEPMLLGKWVWTHNPESYATARFEEALRHLQTGSHFQHTNIPTGFKWEDGWTMEGEMKKRSRGESVGNLKKNGDWSVY